MLIRRVLLAALIAGLVGCVATMPQQQRTYASLTPEELYPMLETILLRYGYQIDTRDYTRGHIATAWRETSGERKGLATWRQQRKYQAWFDIDRFNSTRHMLVLSLSVQERAPIASDWREKKVDTTQDMEYQQILSELDSLVRAKGGLLS